MPESQQEEQRTWNVILVEDDKTVRGQVTEFLSGEVFASGKLGITAFEDLNAALNIIRERKADLVILDVYQGLAKAGRAQVGIQVLDHIKKSGFAPVVLYTALPEGLQSHTSKFVRLVGKNDGLEKLKAEVSDLFQLKIPQLNRAIVDHLDRSLCAYMWGFVQHHWSEFTPILHKPEFTRLVVQRLALRFAREGVAEIAAQVSGGHAPPTSTESDVVHPAEYYIKPPIGKDPLLGDIRVRPSAANNEYLVVLWPSCDMVSTDVQPPKTECALCARALPASDAREITEWLSSPSSGTKKKLVTRLITNNREKSPERYHFLPGVWDIPDLLVDFQLLEHVQLTALRGYSCLATLASPFAEAVGARFQRYVGRLGTPDLDVDAVLSQLSSGRGQSAAGQP